MSSNKANQSVVKVMSREERDLHQARCAKARYKALRKSLPKKQRERDVRAEKLAASKLKVVVEEQGFSSSTSSYTLPILASVATAVVTTVATSAVRRTFAKVDKASDSIANLCDTIKTKLSEFAEFAKSVVGKLWIVPAAILAHTLLNQFIHIPIFPVLSAGFLAVLFGNDIWGVIEPFFRPSEQSGFSGMDIGALICTAVCATMIPTRSVTFAVGELMKRVGSFDRTKDGFESIFKHGLSYAEKVVNAIRSLFSLEEIHWMDASDRLVQSYTEKIDAFERRVLKGEIIPVEDLLAMVEVQLEGMGLKATVRDDYLIKRVERDISRLASLLFPYQGSITGARNFRPEPTFVCFYGGSALGKTTLVTKFATTVLVKSGLVPHDAALKHLWQKGTTEYWNGYTNQKCLIMDDCFQVKPVKGESDNEYMNVIRMIGNWAFALNFADLPSKGKFYFDTPLVIGTTNCACITNQAEVLITAPEAVVRRIKHPYKIWVSKDFQKENGTLDYAKVEATFASNLRKLRGMDDATPDMYLDAYPWDAWYLTKHDFTTPQESGARVEVRALIEEVSQGLVAGAESHAESVANLEEFLAGIAGKPRVELQSGFQWFTKANPLDMLAVVDAGVRDRKPTFVEQARAVVDGVKQFFADFEKSHPRINAALFTAAGVFTLAGVAYLVTTAASAVYTLVSGVYNYLFGKGGSPRGRPIEQSNVKQDKGVPKRVFFRSALEVQDGVEASAHIHKIIYENTYGLYLNYGQDDQQTIGQVQFIENDLAMLPRHFGRQLAERVENGDSFKSDVITFVHPVTANKFKLSIAQFLGMRRITSKDRDVEFILFPSGSFRATKKITQFFLTDQQYQDAIKAAPAVRLDVFEATHDRDGEHKVQKTLTASSFHYMKEITAAGYDNKDVLSYKMDTARGMCGAPLTIAVNRYYGGRCYLGFHVAGAPGLFQHQGFATIITQEMVLDAISKFSITRDNFTEDMAAKGVPVRELTCEEQAGIVGPSKLIDGSFTIIGKVEKPISLSPASKLKLSPIGELELFGPNPQRPAHLRPFTDANGERVCPILKGLEAYQSPLDYRVVDNIDAIVALATKPFREASVDDYRGVFSKVEAVKGVEGLKIKSMARNTSAGYPYVLTTKGGKKEFFGAGDEFSFESEACQELFERVDQIVDSARKNERLAHVFTDFLKDETRPHAKVDAGATRVISGAPLDYVVAFRMYFGAFMAAMFRHHTDSGMCPGINPFSDWFKLATLLKSKGNRVFDGDFKRFDSSEQPFMHMAILDFVNRWYNDSAENQQVRKVLWLDLVHSRHLGGDGYDQSYVYQWNKSLPSGHPFTTPVNSLYSLITLTACYCNATGDFKNMWDNVYIATFGDDNIVNVTDDVSDVFNQVTVADQMRELFGLTYTAGSKTGELVPFTTLDKCTFLKRSFVRDDIGAGGWVAPLDPASFLYIAYYYKNNKDVLGDMRHNLENMLGELSLHSAEMWNHYFPLVVEVLQEGGMVPDFDSRPAYRQMMQARLDAWF